MGGGGTWGDHDVRPAAPGKDYSQEAEKVFEQVKRIDPSMDPKKRTLRTACKHPIVLALDGTGSMGKLPKIFIDKEAMVACQLTEQGYLPGAQTEARISFAIIGDAETDAAPLQVADFCTTRETGVQTRRLWLEGGGGANKVESYQLAAYFYARHCRIAEDAVPFFIFTGDEGFYDTLYARDIAATFGDTVQGNLETKEVFAELLRNFRGNVFLVHRPYVSEGCPSDREVLQQWEGVLGKERIVILREDRAIADMILGILALRGGARTLDEYCEDMRSGRRNLDTGAVEPQDEKRIALVRQALEGIARLGPAEGMQRARPAAPAPPSAVTPTGRRTKKDHQV